MRDPNRKAREMRNAIDMIEGALMGLGDFVDLPRAFVGARDDLIIAPKMRLGEVRSVCKALEECTRIINSAEFDAAPRRNEHLERKRTRNVQG